ncbi:MAG: toprim domain-containing protein [Planctomycetota bacterium]
MNKKFVPVNELLAKTSLDQFISHYSFDTEVRRKGNEERMRSPFACEKCTGNQQVVSVNWQAGVFTSHCYHCNVRGRVTTLLFGMKYGRQPAGGKLKGEEFKDIAADIAIVAGVRGESQSPPPKVQREPAAEINPAPEPTIERKENVPLAKNPDERIARLIHLSDELIREPETMSGRAQAYIGQRPYMTEEQMKKWDVGYLPANNKSMLRSKFVYGLRNERSEKIGFVGRDLNFKEKLAKWEHSDRKAAAPIKAKFPPGFARGSFLYGAEAQRLQSEEAQAQLKDVGIVVTEGMNDTIALDNYGILSVGLCSNRLSEGQIEKLTRWANAMADGKVTLLLDNDKEGADGAIDCLKKLAPHVSVRLAWTPDTASGAFRNKQPEDLDPSSLLELFKPISVGGVVPQLLRQYLETSD